MVRMTSEMRSNTTDGTSGPVALPMAISGCSLDPAALTEQLDRYRRLGHTAAGIQRDSDRILITFAETLDDALLDHTIAIERGCCTSLTVHYDTSSRTLSIAADPAGRDALDAVVFALTEAAGGPGRGPR